MTQIPVIGMSPGNSYFKDEAVTQLIKKVVEQFGKTAVLIADVPAVSTYLALGYPKNRAWRDKALPQGNNLRNRVKRAMDELSYTEEQVRIIDWENEVGNDINYQKKYKDILNLYQTNAAFQKVADDTTGEVLEYADKEITDLNAAIKTAVYYLLSELAFMEFAPEFLKAEVAIYIYHRNWPIYENYIAGNFDNKTRHYLGFTVITA